MKFRFLSILASALVFSAGSHAEQVEWRVLGPAWSQHLDWRGAKFVDTGSKPVDAWCYEGPATPERVLFDAGMPLQSCSWTFSPDYSWSLLSYTTRCGQEVELHSSDQTQSWKVRACQAIAHYRRASWSESNPGIGLERAVRDEDGAAWKVFGSIVRDSYAKWGAMAGLARTWIIAEAAGLRLEAGVEGGLWWRTVMRYTPDPDFYARKSDWPYRQTLKRRVLAVAVPVAALTHDATGLGVQVAYTPRIEINGMELSRCNTWMVQTTFKF